MGCVGILAAFRSPVLDSCGPSPPPAGSSDATLVSRVKSIEAKPALAIWHGIDEPAWSDPVCKSDCNRGCSRYCDPANNVWGSCDGLCEDAIVRAYTTVQSNDDNWSQAPHRVWVNHAPRGKVPDPSNYSLLIPYHRGADIISMDVYPMSATVT